MAVRRPVFYDQSTNSIQELTSAASDAIMHLAVYSNGGGTPVPSLSVVSTGGDFGNIADTRKKAGAYRTFTTRFPNEGETAEPGTVTVNYNRFNQDTGSISEPTDTNNRRYPLYLDGDNNLRAMSETDFFDTFIDPAINLLVDGSDRPGIYKIRTSNAAHTNHSLVSNTAVFSDTRANTGAYTSGGIPETLDQPTTITNYYLFKGNQTWDLVDISEATFLADFKAPLFLNTNGDFEAMNQTNLETLLKDGIDWRASTSSGDSIRYNIDGSGQARGSAMVNTILNGGGAYRTRFVNKNDYRAQEHPNGTAVTANTYVLNINRT